MRVGLDGPSAIVGRLVTGESLSASSDQPPAVAYAIEEVDDRFALKRSDVVLIRATSAEALRQALFDDLQGQLLECAAEHALLHAGVVGFGTGVVVLPGSSHAGKTTLVAALLDEGGTYYSDEHAVVASDGTVEPFARPLVLRDPSVLDRRVHDYPVGVAAAPAALIVITTYEPGATWEPVAITPAEAVMAMVAHSLTIRLRPAETLRAFRSLAASAPAYAGPRGDARAAAAAITELLAR